MCVEEKLADNYQFLTGKYWLTEPLQGLLMQGARKALRRHIKTIGPESILDVCCGAGDVAEYFTRAGIETTGVDSSKSMLARARQKKRLSHYLEQDVTRMAFDAEFDVAYIGLAIHEMSPEVREQVWQNMLNSVKEGGALFILDFAVAHTNSFLSRFWDGFTNMDEKNFLKSNPSHYYNYKEFMKNGGLESWLTQRVERVSSIDTFLAGTMALIRVDK